MSKFKIGDRVRVERDEKEYPARGTWADYRGKTGTVVIASQFGEVGVAFKAVKMDPTAPGGMVRQGSDTTFFLPHELVLIPPGSRGRKDRARAAQEAR